MPRVLVVTGATASGKSELALQVARANGGEIVSADSVQVYRDLNIGSAKPEEQALGEVPHHLISVLDITEDFNAGLFRDKALPVIDDIFNRERLPIIVGGTGLYIKSLLQGLITAPAPSPEVRERIALQVEELRQKSRDEAEFRHLFHGWLAELDPLAARSIRPNDFSRAQRAVVVKLMTQHSICDYFAAHGWESSSLEALVIVICPAREALYSAIEARVDRMISSGLVSEVENIITERQWKCLLISRGLDILPRALGAIGYRHACRFIKGEISCEQLIASLKRDTRRYAKHQLTWWRNEPAKLGWLDLSGEFSEACKLETPKQCVQYCQEFLQQELRGWLDKGYVGGRDRATQEDGYARIRYLVVGCGCSCRPGRCSYGHSVAVAAVR